MSKEFKVSITSGTIVTALFVVAMSPTAPIVMSIASRTFRRCRFFFEPVSRVPILVAYQQGTNNFTL